MFPTELEIKVQHRQLEREAEQYRLVKLARQDSEQPTLWQRLRARGSAAKIYITSTENRPYTVDGDVIALSQ